MAAPSGIVWGSIVTGNKDTRKGRIGLYTSVTSTDTQTTVELQVWFWTMYSCSDGASITLKLDIGTDITAATTTVLTKKAISHTVATGSGWSKSNQTMLYSVSKNYSRGTSAAEYKIFAKFSGIDMLPDKTMSANTSFSVPKLASYTVSYDANGGTDAPSSQTKWHGTNLTLSSSKPTRTGHAFSKWLSTAQNQYYNPGNLYGHNESTTMKAQWTANTYTVSYDANGGSGAPANQTKTYGVSLTLSSTKPTRTNYNFLGWATSASATTATYAAGESYTANSAETLYAVWELAYTKPRITGYSVTRCNASGTKSDSGTYALVKFSWATDKAVSSIKVEWSSSAGSGSTTISASGTSGTVSQVVGNGGISADATYTVKLTVADGADSNHTSTATTTLSGTAFAIDFLAGGKGAAFGKPAEKANALEINWPVYDRFGTVMGNGVAKYGGSGSLQIDPNTTLESLILTNHANNPRNGYSFYIRTVFDSTKSAAQARSQLAEPYGTAGAMYYRRFDGSSWSDWAKILDENATAAVLDSFKLTGNFIHCYPSNTDAKANTNRYGYFGYGTNGIMTLYDSSTKGINLISTAAVRLYGMYSSSAAPYVAVLNDRFRSYQNDAHYLGDSTYKWKAVYAVNGTIQTSDRNQKKNIEEIGQKYIDLFDRLMPVSFMFNDAESDRLHIGFISQDVKAAMDEVGLTDLDFAGYCRDVLTEWDEETQTDKVVLDENGEPVYRYSLRYSEFIALNSKMIQLNRQRIAEQDKEIKSLRDELNALKEAVAKLL